MELKTLPLTVFAAAAWITSAYATPTVYEAEEQTLPTGGAISDTAVYELDMSKGWQIYDTLQTIQISGGKFVNTSGEMTFDVTVSETGLYDLILHMWINDMYVSNNSSIVVDGNTIGTYASNTGTTVNKDFTLTASVKLTTGSSHSIVLKAASSAGVDYLSVERHPKAVFTLDDAPVSAGATESAYKLKHFINHSFGQKTISGMMIGDNIFNYHYGDTLANGDAVLESNYLLRSYAECVAAGMDECHPDDSTSWKGQVDISKFKALTGYYPALGGFDMLFAAGGNSKKAWFRGYSEHNIQMAQELWEAGGIPAFSWHWKVGDDTIFYTHDGGFTNASCTDGVIATSSNNTCFNYTKAFTDETCQEINTASKEYQLMLADIDSLSKHFLILQDSGVAIVWRPLHEASGGWFWWGVAGADCYKALYKLVFDRMVNVNGVKNALWVWNINTDPAIGYDYSALNGDWYPGDEYVDIIGVDIYNSAGDHQSNANYFNKTISEAGLNKVIALTENGPIPDIDSTFEDDAVWSFWMPWYDTWSGNFLSQTSETVWKKNLADDRVYKLENMPGWADYDVGISPASKVRSSAVTLSQQGRSLQLTVPSKSNAALFSLQGKLVKNIGTNLSAGTHTVQLSKLPQGVYIVRVNGANFSASQKVLVR